MPVGKTSTPFLKNTSIWYPKRKWFQDLDSGLFWNERVSTSPVLAFFSISDYVLLSHSHSAQLCSSFQHGLQKCDLRGHGIKNWIYISRFWEHSEIEGQMLSNPIYPQYFFYSFFVWCFSLNTDFPATSWWRACMFNHWNPAGTFGESCTQSTSIALRNYMHT